MIITEIKGGLGNQMFQYACGFSLAARLNSKLKLDLSFYRRSIDSDKTTIRNLDLNIFKIEISQPDTSLINRITNPGFVQRALNRVIKSKFNLFTESSFLFDKRFYSLNDNTYLQGYWQCEKYFIDYARQLRKEFQFPPLNDDVNLSVLRKIQSSNSISIHVRRGDYTDKHNLEFLGVMSIDYYKNAINIIRSKTSSPLFFCFTDDPDWVKENLIKDSSEIILVKGNTGKNSWKDMFLMSQCNHNIIANSSFSWWAAWLNQQPDKVVIAPKKWFATSDPIFKNNNIVPKIWEAI